MRLVAASAGDLDAVIGWIASEQQCRSWAGPSVTYPIERGRLIDQIDFHSANAYVGRDDRGTLAFGQILGAEHARPHLSRIITNPEFRGRGVGRQFCLSLISRASALGGRGITLRVYRNNHHALRLYRALGFEEQNEASGNGIVFMLKTTEQPL